MDEDILEAEEAHNRASAIDALISATKSTQGHEMPDTKVPSVKTLDSLRHRVAAFLREMPETLTVEEILEALEAPVTKAELLGQLTVAAKT